MPLDTQSVLALGIVVLATGFYLYSTVFKKKSDCGAGCGCDNVPKKFPSNKKK
jgi:hypothetical protein